MKQFSIVRLLTSIMFCFLSGSVFGPMVGLEADTAGLAMVAAGRVMSFLPMPQGVAMAGLSQEVWVDALLKKFWAAGLWLSEVTDMSNMVNYNKLNLAEIGVTPEVYMDIVGNVSSVDANDIPSEILLRRFDTQNTKLTIPGLQIERNYDQMLAYTERHKESLRNYFLRYAAYNYAPSSNTANTPVLLATGGDNGAGKKRLTIDDIITLQTKMNLSEAPQNNRILVLDSQHQADLLKADKDLYKAFANPETGQVNQLLYGFKVYVGTSELPKYLDQNTKVAFGAVPPSNACNTSIAFCKSEVMKAEGDYKLYHLPAEMNTTGRADEIGFNARFTAARFRDYGVGAIISPTV